MSKMGNYVLGLEEDAGLMTREEFVRTNGSAVADVWDRVNSEEPNEPEYELMAEGFHGS
jgi:capsid protein